jgi:hypothetical protein
VQQQARLGGRRFQCVLYGGAAGLADVEEMHRAWGQCHHVTIMPKVVPTLPRKGCKR